MSTTIRSATVEQDNPWMADFIEAIAELNDRIAHDGGTKAPPGVEDVDICWYADETFDNAFYVVRDIARALDQDFDFDDDLRVCCGEPVARCSECDHTDSFCLRHNGGDGRCEECRSPLGSPR